MDSNATAHTTPLHVTFYVAAAYVLSGVTQPLLMSLAKAAGLADKSCQLYMFFYYVGPACVVCSLCRDNKNAPRTEAANAPKVGSVWTAVLKVGSIALVDVVASTMNYTGSTMAGPTIFAIVYSSVTVWCAILSRIVLHRRMSYLQWLGVVLVFGGLTVTATDSASLGPSVLNGALLVTVGSALHALMYVLSEAVMKDLDLAPITFCAIFNCVGCAVFALWQIFYTRLHLDDLILEPMREAHTSYGYAALILLAISFMSLVHSTTFFHTVKYFPGGATSAGVMKALQAVLVFVATSLAFCGRLGGEEMCFTISKFISLNVVVVGVLVFGKATDVMKNGGFGLQDGYEIIGNTKAEESTCRTLDI